MMSKSYLLWPYRRPSWRGAAIPEDSNMPRWKQHARGSSKARWEQHPQGERQKKALHIVAHFHEIEYKLASGFTLENDSLWWPISTIRGAGDYFFQHVELFQVRMLQYVEPCYAAPHSILLLIRMLLPRACCSPWAFVGLLLPCLWCCPPPQA